MRSGRIRILLPPPARAGLHERRQRLRRGQLWRHRLACRHPSTMGSWARRSAFS